MKKILCTMVLAACYLILLPASSYALEPDKEERGQKELLILSGAASSGVGDYAYGAKLYHYLKKRYPHVRLLLIFYGNEKAKSRVDRIYAKELQEPDVLWVSYKKTYWGRSYLDSDEEGRISRKLGEFSLPDTKVIHIGSEADNDREGKITHLLISLGLQIDLSIQEMFYCDGDPSPALAQNVLSETLEGMNYGTDKHQSIGRKWWFTEVLFPDKNDEWYKRMLELLGYEGEDDEEDFYFPAAKRTSFGLTSTVPDSYSCEDDPREIQGSDDNKIGLMLSDEQREKTNRFIKSGLPGRVQFLQKKITPELSNFLRILTNKNQYGNQLKWLARRADYFFGYLHDPVSIIDFIASTVRLSENKKTLTYVVNVPDVFDSNQAKFSQLRGLLRKVLLDNGFSRLVYWSEKNNKINTYLLNDDASGKTLRILNPFPVEKAVADTLMMASFSPVVGCTGDHSFYDTLSIGKLPFYEKVPHLFALPLELSAMAKTKGYTHLADYFTAYRADEKSRLLQNPETISEWAGFRDYLWETNNAYKEIDKLINTLWLE